MVSCPACHAPLLAGVLRCRMCGADAREAVETRGVGVSFTLASISPEVNAAAQLLDELAHLSPEIHRAWRSLDGPRKERAAAILAELLRLTPRR